MSELLELCASNKLSLDALQEIINTLGPRVSSQNQLCFYHACRNEKVTLEIVQLLYNTLPGAFRLRDDNRDLPIHYLCDNKDLDENASIDILQFMLEIDPTLPRELGHGGYLAIHSAVMYKSTSFCNELIDAYPQSLRVVAVDGWLPIHFACCWGDRDNAADTIQYMLELDPELINAEDDDEYLPIHRAAINVGGTKSIEMLLKFDPDAATKDVNNGSQQLPLHCACAAYTPNLSSVQILYDAYPEAILISDENGYTPLDLARNQPTKDFIQTQLVYARQAQDVTAMTTIDDDDDGWLPLHRALKDNVPLGSIKLLVKGIPDAVQVSDQNGAYPLHIACEFSSVNLVKYLVELAAVDTLNNVDAKNNSLLHYACRGGNLGAVKYLLERNVPSVSERNNDNMLPLHLLLECGENTYQIKVDKGSIEYIETVWLLLLANPEVVMA